MARRAGLEDDLAALECVRGLDFEELVGATAPEVRQAVARVAALAAGRLQICREMRELDDRLGLTPKAMAQLRWRIATPEEEQEATGTTAANVVTPERWRRGA